MTVTHIEKNAAKDRTSDAGNLSSVAPPTGSVDNDLRYGWFSFRPSCLQRMNNVVGALVFVSLANCLQGMTEGLLGVVLSSIEKQFDLTSSQSAWIASGYEIGALPVLLLCSVLGKRIHRPIAVALGLLSVAAGCVLFFLPQFVSPPYVPQGQSSTADSLCYENKNKTSSANCESDDQATSLSKFLPLFIIARVLTGMGAVPMYSVAINYIDDCSSREKSARYCGMLLATSIIGPALGFVSGATSLDLFTDFYATTDSNEKIGSSDPRWIGAWWLPFTIAAALSLLVIFPVSGYPRDLPGAAEIRSQKKIEAHNAEIETVDADEMLNEKSCSEVFEIAKSVLTNPTCMFLSLFIACDNFLVVGFSAFGPKYFQFGFGMSPSFAGIIFGAVLLPAGASGTIVGGLVIEKLRLTCHQIMKLMTVLASFTTVATIVFLLHCKKIPFAGVNVAYNRTFGSLDTVSSLNNSCNFNCACDATIFQPVCSHDNVQYYSPCFAGCSAEMTSSEKTRFDNCSCVMPPSDRDGDFVVDAGVCSSDLCTGAILFLVIFFFAVFMIYFCITANLSATLRCVTNKQTAFALAIQIFIVKCLGTIPGPLVMGKAFDDTCILWQPLSCGSDAQGSCQFYEISDLARNFLILNLSVKGVSVVAVCVAVALYKPPKVVLTDANKAVVVDDSFGQENSSTAERDTAEHAISGENGFVETGPGVVNGTQTTGVLNEAFFTTELTHF